MKIRIDKNFLILFIVTFAIFLIAAVYYYHKSAQDDSSISMVDFRVYYYAGLRLSMDSNIYDKNDGYFMYKYSPIFALFMSVIKFSTTTLKAALCVWYAILFIAFLISLYLVKELLFDKMPLGEKFSLFDVVPILFILRYIVFINFVHSYAVGGWPKILRVSDFTLLYVLGPAFLFSLFASKKTAGKNYFLIMALAVFFILRFLILNIDRAQVNLIILLLLLFFSYYLLQRKNVLAGLYLGIAIIFKLTPAIFLLYLIVKKKTAALFSSLAAFFALLLMPAFRWGSVRNAELIRDWLESLHATVPWEYLQHKNQSLMAAASRLFSENSDIALVKLGEKPLTILILAVYAAFACVLIYAVARRGKKAEHENALCDFSLLFIAMTFLSPVGTKTTFVHTFLPLAFLLKEAFRRGLTDFWLNASLLLYVLCAYLNASDIIGEFSTTLHKYSLMTWALLVLFFVTIYIKFKRETMRTA